MRWIVTVEGQLARGSKIFFFIRFPLGTLKSKVKSTKAESRFSAEGKRFSESGFGDISSFSLSKDMDPNAARTARESLDLAFHMSNVLNTGLERHTLSVLIALCDLGLNPEALAAVVKELRRELQTASSSPPPSTAQSSLS